jgi:hypothetical protein
MENQDAAADEGMAAELNGNVSNPAPRPSVDERLQKILDKALYADGRPEAQKLRNFLNGTWLGEPLHAVLTDLPVGAWTAAMVFDLVDLILDRREFASARMLPLALDWREQQARLQPASPTGPMWILQPAVSDWFMGY